MSSYLPPHLRKGRSVEIHNGNQQKHNQSLESISKSFIDIPFTRSSLQAVFLGCQKANELAQRLVSVTKSNEASKMVSINLDMPDRDKVIEQILEVVKIPTLSSGRRKLLDEIETVVENSVLFLSANLETFLNLPDDLLGLLKMVFVQHRVNVVLSLEVTFPYINVDELVRRFLHHLPAGIPYNTNVLMVAEGYDKFQLHRYDTVDNELQKLKASLKTNELQVKQVKFI